MSRFLMVQGNMGINVTFSFQTVFCCCSHVIGNMAFDLYWTCTNGPNWLKLLAHNYCLGYLIKQTFIQDFNRSDMSLK